MSGFYLEDMPMLKEEAARHGLRFVRYAEDNRWTMMEFVKE
jgi:ribosomal protein L11 methyltransferase